MFHRICVLTATLAASVLLATPANADGPTRHPMDPNEMPRIIHCVKPVKHRVPAWVCKHLPRKAAACRCGGVGSKR